MKDDKKTKIVCTVGPASDSKETITAMLRAGMNVARLNLSHGTREEQLARIKNIAEVSSETGIPCAIMADLRGPEIRTQQTAKSLSLKTGDTLTVYLDTVPPDSNSITSTHPEILAAVIEEGNEIILGDGIIILKVLKKEKKRIVAEVIYGGKLLPNQRISLLGKKIGLPALTQEDIEDIAVFSRQKVDFFAQSFVRDKNDIELLRKHLKSNNSNADIIAKIEKSSAVQNIEQILDRSDGIMVARGDLGIELPPEDVPIIQKELVKKSLIAGKPVIIATQMLESMTENIRPTRAEASDVANAILDGADAVMLSAETATGKFPVKTVEIMHKIALKAESSLDGSLVMQEKVSWLKKDTTTAISFSSCELSHHLDAVVIITSTHSGTTARQVSRFRPKTPILAITPDKHTFSRLLLSWGVTPALVSPGESTDDMFNKAQDKAQELGLAKKGDTIIITAGVLVNMPGTTNLIKVHKI